MYPMDRLGYPQKEQEGTPSQKGQGVPPPEEFLSHSLDTKLWDNKHYDVTMS